jgi:hypothetical protein
MVNQSQEWLTNTLKFHVGEIPFGTTWSTTFRLKPKIPGCYNIFGEGSGILLNGEETVIPENVICVVEEPKNEPFKSGMLNVTDDDPPNAQYNSTDTDFIPLHWQTYYNSTKPELYSATETVSYRFIDERSPFVVWKEVYSLSVANDKDSVRTYQTMLDIRQFPLACVIQIRIQATAPDARDEILRTIEIVLPEMEYINLT